MLMQMIIWNSDIDYYVFITKNAQMKVADLNPYHLIPQTEAKHFFISIRSVRAVIYIHTGS